MKLKHWQGYGCINATKTSRRVTENYLGEKLCVLNVRVSGNHEWGLEHDDRYDVFKWLVSRFDKACPSYTAITKIETDDHYVGNTEVCDYTITYKL